MPWSHQSDIASLRVAYNVAVTAHAECARTLTEALIRAEPAPAAMIEAELKARHQRDKTRGKLHAAMASSLQPLEPLAPEKPRR
jgi:hypothetical protein